MVTAEEICNQQFLGFKGELWTGVHKAMVAFAKLHVEEALKQAYNNIEYTLEDSSEPYVIENSILNAYPLENIK